MKCLLLLAVVTSAAFADSPARIVSVGGAATETVFALGAGAAVVGVDTSSVYPEKATSLPQVGYQRMLSAEGIASLKPDMVILAATAGPPAALEQLEKLGIPLLRLQEGYNIESTVARVQQIGKALDRASRAEEICRKIEADAAAIAAPRHPPQRVLFVMSAGVGAPMVAGTGTAADAAIRLSGGANVGADFSGYKQLSSEALVALDPEVVVTTSRTMKAAAAGELLPGLSLTTAGKNGRMIVMDDLYLLGFGPRTGEALAEFSKKLAGYRLSAGR